jgi:hypothetical protein
LSRDAGLRRDLREETGLEGKEYHMSLYYNVFISHAWSYGDAYDRLVELLDSAPGFSWLNWSAPSDKPAIPEGMIVPNETVLRAIAQKVNMADCVLVIAGMYANHSAWIQAEMDIARNLSKPLIGVKPWGSERMPQEVYESTVEDVGWNTDSIVSAIKKRCYAR